MPDNRLTAPTPLLPSAAFLIHGDLRQELAWFDSFSAAGKTLVKQAKLPQGYLAVLFCGQRYMRKLHQSYLGRSFVTDVLSWGAVDDSEVFYGNILLCLPQINQQAKTYKLTPQNEALRLLAHGLAHLAGYDHQQPRAEKLMLQFEIDLLKTIGLEAIYR